MSHIDTITNNHSRAPQMAQTVTIHPCDIRSIRRATCWMMSMSMSIYKYCDCDGCIIVIAITSTSIIMFNVMVIWHIHNDDDGGFQIMFHIQQCRTGKSSRPVNVNVENRHISQTNKPIAGIPRHRIYQDDKTKMRRKKQRETNKNKYSLFNIKYMYNVNFLCKFLEIFFSFCSLTNIFQSFVTITGQSSITSPAIAYLQLQDKQPDYSLRFAGVSVGSEFSEI